MSSSKSLKYSIFTSNGSGKYFSLFFGGKKLTKVVSGEKFLRDKEQKEAESHFSRLKIIKHYPELFHVTRSHVDYTRARFR